LKHSLKTRIHERGVEILLFFYEEGGEKMYISKRKIAEARSLDLLTYLRCYDPGELVRLSSRVYTTRTHDSLKISNGKWYWWSRSIGGRSALDYLVAVKGMRFQDAVMYILKLNSGMSISRPSHVKKADKESELHIPNGRRSNEKIKLYLERRGISESVINQCINDGLIYESVYGEVVFLGFNQDGEVKYASCRSCDESRNMRDCRGSKKEYSFRTGEGKCDTVHVFESAIDALSYATILDYEYKDWTKFDLLSLGGVAFGKQDGMITMPKALKHYLESNSNAKRICLHLDNDEAGRTAARLINDGIGKNYEIRLLFPPMGKDYNEYLQMKMRKERENGEKRNIESDYRKTGRDR